MSKESRIVVQRRAKVGTSECRRLRRQGLVPGNVYGHGQDPTPVIVNADDIQNLLQSHTRVVEIDCDGQAEKTIVREIQWDNLGSSIQHIDLLRVDPNERVTVDVQVETRGTAPGILSGGILEQPLRHLTIDCLAYQIPGQITVRIASLGLGQSIYVRDLDIPEHIHVQTPEDSVVVHIVAPRAEVEAEEGEGAAAEPEVVGRKAEADED